MRHRGEVINECRELVDRAGKGIRRQKLLCPQKIDQAGHRSRAHNSVGVQTVLLLEFHHPQLCFGPKLSIGGERNEVQATQRFRPVAAVVIEVTLRLHEHTAVFTSEFPNRQMVGECAGRERNRRLFAEPVSARVEILARRGS